MEYSKLASQFYDLTKPIDGEYPDVAYYLQVLGDKKQRILEVGAGTGRLCIPLRRHGYKIEALECSKPMLEILAKNVKKSKCQLPIHALRAEEMPFTDEFDAILVSFGTFQMFSFTQAQKCLALFKKALKKNGRLFVDLDVIRPELHKAGLKSHGVTIPLSKDENILLEGSRTWNFVEQSESVQLRYELWKGQQLKTTEVQFFSLRWYGIWEFEALLKHAGFKKIEFLADYFETDADAETQMLNFVATS